MKSTSQYIIPYKGLNIGKHLFTYNVDEKFFELFEDSEVNKGKVHIDVELNKKSTILEITFKLFGEAILPCDRCLDDVTLPIENEIILFVNFGEETEEQSDNLLLLSHSEYELDISQYIYEYIILSIPITRIHPNDKKGKSTCNKEMLKTLSKYLVQKTETETTDPRWDDLKNILNNN